jgi:hypothetical protein
MSACLLAVMKAIRGEILTKMHNGQQEMKSNQVKGRNSKGN